LRLGALATTERPFSEAAAVVAAAIPLRKAAAGGRTEDFNAHRVPD
jgi:hypothetical protein